MLLFLPLVWWLSRGDWIQPLPEYIVYPEWITYGQSLLEADVNSFSIVYTWSRAKIAYDKDNLFYNGKSLTWLQLDWLKPVLLYQRVIQYDEYYDYNGLLDRENIYFGLWNDLYYRSISDYRSISGATHTINKIDWVVFDATYREYNVYKNRLIYNDHLIYKWSIVSWVDAKDIILLWENKESWFFVYDNALVYWNGELIYYFVDDWPYRSVWNKSDFYTSIEWVYINDIHYKDHLIQDEQYFYFLESKARPWSNYGRIYSIWKLPKVAYEALSWHFYKDDNGIFMAHRLTADWINYFTGVESKTFWYFWKLDFLELYKDKNFIYSKPWISWDQNWTRDSWLKNICGNSNPHCINVNEAVIVWKLIKDSKNIFYYDMQTQSLKKIEEKIDAKTFTWAEWSRVYNNSNTLFCKDKNGIYSYSPSWLQKYAWMDKNSFVHLWNKYFQDKNGIYRIGTYNSDTWTYAFQKMPNADSKSFEVLFSGRQDNEWAKDKNMVYRQWEPYTIVSVNDFDPTKPLWFTYQPELSRKSWCVNKITYWTSISYDNYDLDKEHKKEEYVCCDDIIQWDDFTQINPHFAKTTAAVYTLWFVQWVNEYATQPVCRQTEISPEWLEILWNPQPIVNRYTSREYNNRNDNLVDKINANYYYYLKNKDWFYHTIFDKICNTSWIAPTDWTEWYCDPTFFPNKIEWIDQKSFTVLNDFYAKDNKSVYFGSEPMTPFNDSAQHIDPKTFTILTGKIDNFWKRIATDWKNIYIDWAIARSKWFFWQEINTITYHGMWIISVPNNGFMKLNNWKSPTMEQINRMYPSDLSCDTNIVPSGLCYDSNTWYAYQALLNDWYNEMYATNIDMKTFKKIAWYYYKDKDSVYILSSNYALQKLPWADPNTFQVLNTHMHNQIAKDKDALFCNTKSITTNTKHINVFVANRFTIISDWKKFFTTDCSILPFADFKESMKLLYKQYQEEHVLPTVKQVEQSLKYYTITNSPWYDEYVQSINTYEAWYDTRKNPVVTGLMRLITHIKAVKNS